MLIHSLRADDALSDLSAASKLCTDWSFLQILRDRGREAMSVWLERHFDDVGKRQTVDLHAQFLDSGSEMRALPTIPHGTPKASAKKRRAAVVPAKKRATVTKAAKSKRKST